MAGQQGNSTEQQGTGAKPQRKIAKQQHNKSIY